MRIRTRVLSMLGVVSLASAIGVAQTPGASDVPAFEVASVKRAAPGPGKFGLTFRPGGRFVANGVTLRQLIGAAYADGAPLADFQIIGSVGWMNNDRFDINAKAEGDPQAGPNGPPPQMFLMVRTLLGERFKLAIHKETRELPIYELVVARRDGKLGPRLHPSNVDCAAMMAAARAGGGDGLPRRLPPGERMPCSMRTLPGNVTGGSMRMAQLAAALARMPMVNRPVVDKTGLDGSFDFDLEFTPEKMLPADAPLPPGLAALPPIDPNGPSLFTALQEQWGLKLESAKGPVAVVVIDHAEPPTED